MQILPNATRLVGFVCFFVVQHERSNALNVGREEASGEETENKDGILGEGIVDIVELDGVFMDLVDWSNARIDAEGKRVLPETPQQLRKSWSVGSNFLDEERFRAWWASLRCHFARIDFVKNAINPVRRVPDSVQMSADAEESRQIERRVDQ